MGSRAYGIIIFDHHPFLSITYGMSRRNFRMVRVVLRRRSRIGKGKQQRIESGAAEKCIGLVASRLKMEVIAGFWLGSRLPPGMEQLSLLFQTVSRCAKLATVRDGPWVKNNLARATCDMSCHDGRRLGPRGEWSLRTQTEGIITGK